MMKRKDEGISDGGPDSLAMMRQNIQPFVERKALKTTGEARMKTPRSDSELLAERLAVRQSVFNASSGQDGALAVVVPKLAKVK